MARTRKVLAPARLREITISDQQWTEIEKAYGPTLSREVRAEIEGVTFQFVNCAISEHDAIPVKSIRKRAAKIADLSESLLRQVGGQDWRQEIFDEATSRPTIHEILSQAIYQLRNGNEFYQLIAVLALTSDTLKIASTNLGASSDTAYKGWAWEQWVTSLTEIAKGAGLPHTVRKDADKRKPGDPISAFVLLIKELQNCVPEQCRRQFTSRKRTEDIDTDALQDAIAQAVYRAR